MTQTALIILFSILFFIVGIGLTIAIFYLVPALKAKRAAKQADKILKDAEIKAEHIIKNADIDAKQLVYEAKIEADKDIKEKKAELQITQRQIHEREKALDRKDFALMSKEQSLDDQKENYNKKLNFLNKRESELQEKIDAIIKELEKVSGMSTQEARDELFSRMEAKLNRELSIYVKNREEEAELTANEKARDILVNAIAKYSQEVTTERTISVVELPNEDMKGRIIGREGRNIRTLEKILGVDILIDDTPEVITVSCFDPIRREIARRSLETLIQDGRIQPSRIEEVIEKTRQEVDEIILEAGKDAVFELGLPMINQELIKYVGRLKYRTSYGQSALKHTLEVAHLAGIMASELGLDPLMAKRAGLMHDIGKAADFELEGSHVEVGVRLAKRFGEPDYVIDAIESHHEDKEAHFIYSYLVIAADTLSAARPGARSETMENYINRMKELEDICNSYEGIETSYAVQSGRELRVMVQPEKINDEDTAILARKIKERIENEMTYPGQITVNVIREYRAQDVAK